ncbi:Z1 domain-containing protein [Ureaplasma ceti]|uniref:Putative endonuclease Z1 domain-containing protein n=1 Tax=Ureaplasma ceti TaxID=3119530 RepID=A0ABP9UAQ9_9BACT
MNNIFRWNNFDFGKNDDKNDDELIYSYKNYDLFNKFLDSKRNKMRNFISNEQTIIKDIETYKNTVESVYQSIQNNKKFSPLKLLVFGSIQSGKTDFMIGFSSKILEQYKGLNVTLVLSSNNKNLLTQTILRFKNEFTKINAEAQFLSFNDLKNWQPSDELNGNEHIFVFLLKEHNNLKLFFNEFLSKLSTYKHNINNLTILDDEGDVASFGNINKDFTTINECITDILKSINWNITYISVTATPFAHVMVDNEDDLKPNFAFTLNPGSGYVGIDFYAEEMQSGSSKIIKTIDSSFEEGNYSFQEALFNYLLQCVIYLSNYNCFHGAKPRMLINIDRKKVVHEIIESKVYEFLNKYFYTDKYTNFVISELKTYIKENYYIDKSGVAKTYNLLNPNESENIFKLIKEQILNKLEVIVFNGDTPKNPSFNINFDETNLETFQIVIGSDKLSRGLTFMNLTTTYLERNTEQADSILQAARFLGYRDQYKYLSKIYLTPELIEDYINCSWAIDYYKSILSNRENEEFVELVPRFFPLKTHGSNLNATRISISKMYSEESNDTALTNTKYTPSIYGSVCPINKANEEVFYKFICNTQIYTKNDYKTLKFDSIEDFNNYFFTGYSEEQLFKQYQLMFGEHLSKNIYSKILDWNKKVIVRYIYNCSKNIEDFKDINNPNYSWKYRRVVFCNNNGLKVFGKGSYANYFEYINNDEIFCIDIIPLAIYENSKDEHNIKTFRLSTIPPKSIINSLGNGIWAI